MTAARTLNVSLLLCALVSQTSLTRSRGKNFTNPVAFQSGIVHPFSFFQRYPSNDLSVVTCSGMRCLDTNASEALSQLNLTPPFSNLLPPCGLTPGPPGVLLFFFRELSHYTAQSDPRCPLEQRNSLAAHSSTAFKISHGCTPTQSLTERDSGGEALRP